VSGGARGDAGALPPGQRVDFYYGIGSRYSYLASTQIASLEAATGCSVVWRPLDSVRLLAERGRSPFEGEPRSGQYEWSYRETDARRWAVLYGVPFVEPRGRLALDPELLALACTAAARLGRVQAFSRELFAAVFGGAASAVDAAECGRRARACGLDAAEFERALASPETPQQLEATLRAARQAGVFGVPSFVVGGELFWGNDRLALLRHHLECGHGGDRST
jgi:2-hydroxychromene-2-carboxylate isomerase